MDYLPEHAGPSVYRDERDERPLHPDDVRKLRKFKKRNIEKGRRGAHGNRKRLKAKARKKRKGRLGNYVHQNTKNKHRRVRNAKGNLKRHVIRLPEWTKKQKGGKQSKKKKFTKTKRPLKHKY